MRGYEDRLLAPEDNPADDEEPVPPDDPPDDEWGDEGEEEEGGSTTDVPQDPSPSLEAQIQTLIPLVRDTLTDSPAVGFVLIAVDAQGKTSGAIQTVPLGRSLTEAEAGSLHLALGYIQTGLVATIYDTTSGFSRSTN